MTKRRKLKTDPFEAKPERKEVIRGASMPDGAAPGGTPGWMIHLSKKE